MSLVNTDLFPAAAPKADKNKAVAYLNWSIPTANGEIKSTKGFPIFQNPAFKNAKEDLLIALAQKHGGEVELVMNVKIVIPKPTEEIDLDSITSIITKPAVNE